MQISCDVEMSISVHRGEVIIEIGQVGGATMGRESVSLVRLVDEAIATALRPDGQLSKAEWSELNLTRLALDMCRARLVKVLAPEAVAGLG